MPARRSKRMIVQRHIRTDEEKIVRVTQLPVVRCDVCKVTMAHRPGKAQEVLNAHYQKKHPDITER